MRQAASRERVLVLGNVGPSLTVIRSLGRAGFDVVVGRDAAAPLVDRSRYATEFWTHPSPDHEERGFVRALSEFLAYRPDVALVFPVGEKALACLAHHAGELPARSGLVMPDARTLLMCLDKNTACETASELGIPVPRCRRAFSVQELSAAADDVGYPCVVKPVNSLRPFLGRKAILCRTSDALRRELGAWPPGHECLLVQEYIAGYRHNCHFAALDGVMLAYFEHRSLRTDRTDGMGHEVCGQSVRPTAPLRRHTAALVAQLKYSGVGCAQFITDDETGACGFMEVNPRLDGTCALAYHCGYDFPRLAVECATGIATCARVPASYPAGKRIHWGIGDIQGLGAALRRRDIGFDAAIKWAGQIIQEAFRSDLDLTWRWSDPVPTLAVCASVVRSVAKRAWSAWRRDG